ncbi:CopD family protein [Luteipulveratus sp. YIM 133132]|uniref:CopD family protein n=1 Tax=Luteipulveratus flavus TaxID=3031728 RepID=UPI0023AFE01A|nr:CopD family protein [Luteipulveratus sp. YIM 133132]MDE9365411.1 CopD family protein [Luteipulveratus sp. YIM 133132]
MIAAAAAAGDDGLRTALVGLFRVVGYLGFVLLVGTMFVLSWLWPERRPVPMIDRLYDLGVLLVAVSAAAVPVIAFSRGWASFGGREGALALARMALAAVAFAFRQDVLSSARQLRVPILVWQLLIIETYVLASDAWGGPWAWVKIIATTGHLAATAAWLGGLAVLAVVLVPGTALDVLHAVLPKFSPVAIGSVITLVVSGVLHALAVAGGVRQLVDSSYGTVLGIKVLVFAVLLLLGNVGRRHTERVAHRKLENIDGSSSPAGIQAFAVAVGAELAVAACVLATTAVLVHLVPVR